MVYVTYSLFGFCNMFDLCNMFYLDPIICYIVMTYVVMLSVFLLSVHPDNKYIKTKNVDHRL